MEEKNFTTCNFGCLKILEDLIKEKVEAEDLTTFDSRHRSRAVKNIFDGLKNNFISYQRAFFKGDSFLQEHFKIGIERHMDYLDEYLETGDIKQTCGYMRFDDIK